jgi:pimeloyl-ACP methyl ester carboxylesterase
VEGAETLAPLLEAYSVHLVDADPGELTEGLKSLLSPPDVAVVNGGLAEELIAVTSEGIRATREGWLDDDLAFVKPWGFDLEAISVPLQLWQGRQDLMVPLGHGEWLAEHLPAADVQLSDEDGHLSVEQRRIGDVHAWLLERY